MIGDSDDAAREERMAARLEEFRARIERHAEALAALDAVTQRMDRPAHRFRLPPEKSGAA